MAFRLLADLHPLGTPSTYEAEHCLPSAFQSDGSILDLVSFLFHLCPLPPLICFTSPESIAGEASHGSISPSGHGPFSLLVTVRLSDIIPFPFFCSSLAQMLYLLLALQLDSPLVLSLLPLLVLTSPQLRNQP